MNNVLRYFEVLFYGKTSLAGLLNKKCPKKRYDYFKVARDDFFLMFEFEFCS